MTARVRIHRGAHEIGGTCIELECDGKRLLLDLGRPLDDGAALALPEVAGLAAGDDPSLVGVILTHGHADHVGLAHLAHPNVPLYLGEATERILREAAFFSRDRTVLRARGHLRDLVPLRLGPFTVTPYLVDHSAFDAYALLVEVAGGRLFYSGDLRAHGRKPGTFQRLLDHPPRDVDVLLLEGTRVGRPGSMDTGLTDEDDVERLATEAFRNTPGIVLAFYSVQNIDRLVTLFRAARRAGRRLVLDLFGVAVTAATGNPNIPQAGWDEVQVFVPHSQRRRVIEEKAFARIDPIRGARVYPTELAREANELVLTFRHSMRRDVERAGCLSGASALWSMWPGYLDAPSGEATRSWLDSHGIPLQVAHASGHATVADLQRLARAIDATGVVPVHTSAPADFPSLFEGAELRRDGEWWDL